MQVRPSEEKEPHCTAVVVVYGVVYYGVYCVVNCVVYCVLCTVYYMYCVLCTSTEENQMRVRVYTLLVLKH